MKNRLLALAAACLLAAAALAGCQNISGGGSSASNSGAPTTPATPATPTTPTTQPSLYRDANISYASWTDLAGGKVADFAIGDWDSTVSVAVSNGVAEMTVLDAAAAKHFSGGTLAQLPSQAESGSYYSFSGVSAIKFRIKSATLAPSAVKFTLQNAEGTSLIDGVALSSYGVTAMRDWTEVSIPVSSFASQKIKVAFALFLGTDIGSSVEVKDIGFLDASGGNADIAKTVFWPETPAVIKARMSIAWQDEFNGTSAAPNSNLWNWETTDTIGGGWGNNEAQTYTDSRTNSFVSGGTLKIQSVKDANGNWTSARMTTKGKKDFTYGYVEFRAKLPAGLGSWPALWMLPSGTNYGSVYWPDNGEIDVMEASTALWGAGNVRSTLHRNAGSGGAGAGIANETIQTATGGFHLYAVYWSADKIVCYYDDVKQGEYLRSGGSGWQWWPFDKNFHVIMNLAMGGTLGSTIDSSLSADVMEVDYVRVYQ